ARGATFRIGNVARGLVVVQVALSVCLLIVAAAMVRGVLRRAPAGGSAPAASPPPRGRRMAGGTGVPAHDAGTRDLLYSNPRHGVVDAEWRALRGSRRTTRAPGCYAIPRCRAARRAARGRGVAPSRRLERLAARCARGRRLRQAAGPPARARGRPYTRLFRD